MSGRGQVFRAHQAHSQALEGTPEHPTPQLPNLANEKFCGAT